MNGNRTEKSKYIHQSSRNETSPMMQYFNPAKEKPLEWWFVHGRFSCEDNKEHYFVASLFRFWKEEEKQYLHSMFFAFLKNAGEAHEYQSFIDNPLLQAYWKEITLQKYGLDKDIVKVFFEETRSDIPIRPFKLFHNIPNLESCFNKVSVDGLNITLREDGFRVCINLEGHFLKLILKNKNGIVFGQTAEGLQDKKETVYITSPNLELSGTWNEIPIRGTAWFDRQWVEKGFMVKPQGDSSIERFVGWDWFGINLEDGSDLIVFRFFYPHSMKIISAYAKWFKKDGSFQHTERVEIISRRKWKSPDTKITYPIEWHIRLNEFSMELEIMPLTDNQEIKIYAVTRAIWEGACKISAWINGEILSGYARAELNGYGILYKYSQFVSSITEIVDEELEKFFPKNLDGQWVKKYVDPEPRWNIDTESYTRNIAEPAWELLSRGGKRWRPLFGVLIYEALGGKLEPYKELLVIPELIHTGALIIDDIEDESEMRRNGKTIHLLYGVDVALNVGNTLYFLPLTLIAKHPLLTDKQKLELYKLSNQLQIKASFGQCSDIYRAKNLSTERLKDWIKNDMEGIIYQMMSYKTASGAVASAKFAMILANVTEKVWNAGVRFSENFGVAFQIMDDVKNFTDSHKFNKKTGEDLEQGKINLVTISAVKLLPLAEGEELISILCNRNLRKEKKYFDRGLELIRKSGALEKCLQLASSIIEQAWQPFASLLPPSEPKIILKVLCRKVISSDQDLSA